MFSRRGLCRDAAVVLTLLGLVLAPCVGDLAQDATGPRFQLGVLEPVLAGIGAEVTVSVFDPGIIEAEPIFGLPIADNRCPLCGLCGQAPSDYPDAARVRLEPGIEALSLNPDRVPATPLAVLEIENSLEASPAGQVADVG